MLRERLVEALGAGAVKTAPEDLAVYAFDAYTEAGMPSAVVLPESTRDVCAVVKIARELGEPIVARGAGTGLCGGAVPAAGGVIVSFARMNKVLELDERNRRARVQPGLINLDLSRHAAAQRALLRARSVVAEDLDDRRQHRDERRRRALPVVRDDGQPRAGARGRGRTRRGVRDER